MIYKNQTSIELSTLVLEALKNCKFVTFTGTWFNFPDFSFEKPKSTRLKTIDTIRGKQLVGKYID